MKNSSEEYEAKANDAMARSYEEALVWATLCHAAAVKESAPPKTYTVDEAMASIKLTAEEMEIPRGCSVCAHLRHHGTGCTQDGCNCTSYPTGSVGAQSWAASHSWRCPSRMHDHGTLCSLMCPGCKE